MYIPLRSLPFHIPLMFPLQLLKISGICTLFQPIKLQIFSILTIIHNIEMTKETLNTTKSIIFKTKQKRYAQCFKNYRTEILLQIFSKIIDTPLANIWSYITSHSKESKVFLFRHANAIVLESIYIIWK